jgi:hypothetical protein
MDSLPEALAHCTRPVKLLQSQISEYFVLQFLRQRIPQSRSSFAHCARLAKTFLHAQIGECIVHIQHSTTCIVRIRIVLHFRCRRVSFTSTLRTDHQRVIMQLVLRSRSSYNCREICNDNLHNMYCSLQRDRQCRGNYITNASDLLNGYPRENCLHCFSCYFILAPEERCR